jgi:two-component sensor histidine kinase
MGDRLRIRQIMTNLLSNAIKFTSFGAVTVNVSAQHDPAECLRMEISDTGMGIPQQDLDKLFLPFFQSSNSDSLMLSGTGLGLTISNSLAERMHGRISVASELGKGSRFTLELPLYPATATDEATPNFSDRSQASSLEGLHILVAEDNPINTQLIKAYLKGVTDNLLYVADGQQAYEATLDHPEGFDLILMGRESIDYNSGVVHAMVGDLLGLPSVSPVMKLEIDGMKVKMSIEIEGGKEQVEASLPLVAGCQEPIAEWKIPNMRGIMSARTKPLKVVEAKTAASQVSLRKFELPAPKGAVKMISADNVGELVTRLKTEAKVL